MKKSLIRVLISLFLCCCLVLNVVSIPARASSAGAIGIIKASTVTGNPYVITAALLIALGIYAGVDSGAFETVANNCVDALEAAGTWIKDGVTELLRTEDADGNASYYVDSGFMEDVRSWAYESGTVSMGSPYVYVQTGSFYSDQGLRSFSSTAPVSVGYGVVGSRVITLFWSTSDFFVTYGDNYTASASSSGNGLYRYFLGNSVSNIPDYQSWPLNLGIHDVSVGSNAKAAAWLISNVVSVAPDVPVVSYDINLGSFPLQSSNLTDGTSARAWSEDYTDRGLKVYGGGSGNNNNDGKWFWKLMLPLTAADLLLMSQADEWSGETPKEFDDYTTVEELEIVSRPEVEFGQGLELAPVSSPSPDPGTGTNPDTETDTDSDTGTNTGTNFFDSLSEFFTPSGDITMYSLDLKDLFPFCIPFDIYDFLAALLADPVPPVFEFDLNLGVATEPMKIDLSNWSDLAAIIRTLELGLFCVGLALKTRELIGG